jgi:hypothetical protein
MFRLKRIWETEKRLSDHLKDVKPKKVALIFFHGLGDVYMGIEPIRTLCTLYPDIQFTLILQQGLGFEELKNDLPCDVIFTGDLSLYENTDDYDIVADLDFPMNEGQTEYTKGQWCCIKELGIEPNEIIYPTLDCGKNRLIAISYQITCLPGACNPDRDTAERIWNDVLEAGYIPIEMHFQHVFHNPVNKKFDFIDATVRRCQPRISSLVGLINQCAGVICVVSGNLHVALSNLPHERIFFLEKDFKLESFIKSDKISRADVRDYKGEVKEWLKKLEEM